MASTTTNPAVTNDIERATAAMILASMQALQNETQHRKELLKRDLIQRDQLQADREEDSNLSLPMRKRNYEFEEARAQAMHEDRMQKLTEMQENERRFRRCEIERLNGKSNRILAFDLQEATIEKELAVLEWEHRDFLRSRQREQTVKTNKRIIEQMQREAEQNIEDELHAQRVEAAEYEYQSRKKQVKKQRLMNCFQYDIDKATDYVRLGEKHGFRIPDHLF